MAKRARSRKEARSASPDIWRRLDSLARNLWWSWNPDAQNLFASIDVALWNATHHNPIRLINLLSTERREVIETDPRFTEHLDRVERSLQHYLSTKTWFDRTYKNRSLRNGNTLVAYFCSEFAIHESLPQYSGGLGVLAGDHIKSASDLGVPLVGVGLLYGNGYYTQEFAADGATRVIYPKIDFVDVPITDTGKTIDVRMSGSKTIRAKIWRELVGRVPIYLLDTDVAPNSPNDRKLTRHLYGGDREYRIRQEILLGVGGVLALQTLGIKPSVYHLNEGHAAFATLERMRRFIYNGLARDQAERDVRDSTVFTTHTPVPAGNDRFEPKLALKYIGRFAREMGLSPHDLLALGREDPQDKHEPFCMTVLALKLAARCNGVAALHGDTSRKMWTKVFNTTDPSRVPIKSVTNGVHSETWLAPEMRGVYDQYLKPKWNGAGPENDFWSRAGKIPSHELWAMRQLLRARLVRFVRQRLVEQRIRQHAAQDEIVDAQRVLSDDALTIGFARRFATYKRGTLIFHDPRRLARILSNPNRPIQILFAGKAHPADLGGQQFAQQIHAFTRDPRFKGRVVILEDYDMELGRMLTSGCDVWLNNPLRPQEASGTSGMKPPLHGGINCSILDGWWPEAFDGTNGWAIGDESQLADQTKQDAKDARAIYSLFESELAPEFFGSRDARGVPTKWAKRMVRSMQTVCAAFSTTRMVAEYCRDYYIPAAIAARADSACHHRRSEYDGSVRSQPRALMDPGTSRDRNSAKECAGVAGETDLHKTLKKEACRWLYRMGYRCIAAEVRLRPLGIIDAVGTGLFRPYHNYLGARCELPQACIIECKASRSDFLRDQSNDGQMLLSMMERKGNLLGSKRRTRRQRWAALRQSVGLGKFDACLAQPMANLHYVLAPAGVVQKKDLAPRWGLLTMGESGISVAVRAGWQDCARTGYVESAIARTLTGDIFRADDRAIASVNRAIFTQQTELADRLRSVMPKMLIDPEKLQPQMNTDEHR